MLPEQQGKPNVLPLLPDLAAKPSRNSRLASRTPLHLHLVLQHPRLIIVVATATHRSAVHDAREVEFKALRWRKILACELRSMEARTMWLARWSHGVAAELHLVVVSTAGSRDCGCGTERGQLLQVQLMRAPLPLSLLSLLLDTLLSLLCCIVLAVLFNIKISSTTVEHQSGTWYHLGSRHGAASYWQDWVGGEMEESGCRV